MKPPTKIAIALFLTISFLLNPFQFVEGQRSGFSISPENPEIAFFEFTLNPGESVDDAINAKNFSSDKVQMMVKVVEAQTALNGGLSFDFARTAGASQWVTINTENQFELRGSNMKRLPFTVTVPPGTPPGEYTIGFLAALVPTTPTPLPGGGNTTGGYAIDVITRVGVALVVHVPGPELCKLELTNMNVSIFNADWRFESTVQNTGNIHFSGTSQLNVYSKNSKQKIAEANQKIGYFATNSELLSYNKLPIPEQGEYTFDYILTDTKNPTCKLTYTGETTYGQEEQNLLATQATNIAIYTKPTNTSEPLVSATPGLIKQVQTRGTTAWYVWMSAVLFLISLGFELVPRV
jgi:hypothetical protein